MVVRRIEGLRIERAADEILVVNAATSEGHALNRSAAVIFDLCDGTVSKADMAAALQRRTGLPADERIVDLGLAELVDAGLVELDSPEPPASTSRRSLIRKFSLSAAAMLMLPVVETILVPPASAQGSAPDAESSFVVPCPTPTPTTL